MAGNYKNDDIEAQNDAAESGEVSETRTESDKTDGEDYEKVCLPPAGKQSREDDHHAGRNHHLFRLYAAGF